MARQKQALRKHLKLQPKQLLLCLLVLLLPATSFSALTVTTITNPDFGIMFSGASGRQFVLNTDGTVSGSDFADHIGGQVVGSLTVGDTSSPSTITIVADNALSFGGISVNKVLCSYNGGVQTDCDGSGMTVTSVSSATLKMGFDIITSQTHNGGDTASVTIDITVTYL